MYKITFYFHEDKCISYHYYDLLDILYDLKYDLYKLDSLCNYWVIERVKDE